MIIAKNLKSVCNDIRNTPLIKDEKKGVFDKALNELTTLLQEGKSIDNIIDIVNADNSNQCSNIKVILKSNSGKLLSKGATKFLLLLAYLKKPECFDANGAINVTTANDEICKLAGLPVYKSSYLKSCAIENKQFKFGNNEYSTFDLNVTYKEGEGYLFSKKSSKTVNNIVCMNKCKNNNSKKEFEYFIKDEINGTSGNKLDLADQKQSTMKVNLGEIIGDYTGTVENFKKAINSGHILLTNTKNAVNGTLISGSGVYYSTVDNKPSNGIIEVKSYVNGLPRTDTEVMNNNEFYIDGINRFNDVVCDKLGCNYRNGVKFTGENAGSFYFDGVKCSDMVVNDKKVQPTLIKEVTFTNVYANKAACMPIPHKDIDKIGSIVVGDLHGNFLKLLDHLVMWNVIEIKSDDYNSLRINPSLLMKNSWLETNVKVKPNHPHLTFLGDIFCDRNEYDGEKLKLFTFLNENNAKFSIIYSNHDSEFIRHIHNFYGFFDFPPRVNKMKFDNDTPRENVIKDFISLFEKRYNLLEYDLNSKQFLSHAPINLLSFCLIDFYLLNSQKILNSDSKDQETINNNYKSYMNYIECELKLNYIGLSNKEQRDSLKTSLENSKDGYIKFKKYILNDIKNLINMNVKNENDFKLYIEEINTLFKKDLIDKIKSMSTSKTPEDKGLDYIKFNILFYNKAVWQRREEWVVGDQSMVEGFEKYIIRHISGHDKYNKNENNDSKKNFSLDNDCGKYNKQTSQFVDSFPDNEDILITFKTKESS